MTLLDVSIVNVALPSIRDDLHLSPGELQWVLSGYALTFGLVLVPAGRFGDARGRRTVVRRRPGRVHPGQLAAGLATSAGLADRRPADPGRRRRRGQPAGVRPDPAAVRAAPSGAARSACWAPPSASPPRSARCSAACSSRSSAPSPGWRWIFFINLPIGIAAIVLGWRWIPARAGRPARPAEPGPGRAWCCSASAVLLLLLPLVQEREWHGQAKWLLVVAGVRGAGRLRGLGAPVRPARHHRWSTWACSRSARTPWAR